MKLMPLPTLSLRNRLLLVVLGAIFAVGLFGLAVLAWQVSRQQTGVWDATLRSVASQLVLSLPANVDALGAQPGLSLPAPAAFDGDKISFQIWAGQPRRLVLYSPGAGSTALAPAALQQRGVIQEAHTDEQVAGQPWRVFSMTDAQQQVLVQVGRPKAQYQADLWRWVAGSAATAGVLFVALAAAIWAVVRWSMAPVQALAQAIEERATGNIDPLAAQHLPRELRPLLDSFNVMLKRVDDAVQSERHFIADAAHELRTPLSALLLHADVAQRAYQAGRSAELGLALQQLGDVAMRGARLSEQLLDSARLDSPGAQQLPVPVALHRLVEMVASDFEARAESRQQRLVVSVSAAEVLGHVDELGILVRNLIDNALRYSPPASTVTVLCEPANGAELAHVRLWVGDEGPGLPTAAPDLLMQRFRRGAPNHQRGSGIGLSLVARAAALHGANLSFGPGLHSGGLGVTVLFAPTTAVRP
jgi:two-component system, OmpR family, sensor histidine kinase QseC